MLDHLQLIQNQIVLDNHQYLEDIESFSGSNTERLWKITIKEDKK